MASPASALLCAVIGLVLWTAVGWIFARRLACDRPLALSVAPALGWAVQSVIALTTALVGGFSWMALLGAPAVVCALALAVGRTDAKGEPADIDGFPLWISAIAAVVALAPAAAVLPKVTEGGVFLAAPMFDHSKIALIDEILRSGVPPGNPAFAEGGGAGRMAYYYLWHFSAAELAYMTDASGWEADVAATWFTAYATLLLMAGLALRFSKRALAPFLALALACGGSLRPVLDWLFGAERMDGALQPATGLAGWLFQVSWSPHHVAAAACAVLAALLMTRLARAPSIFAAITLALVLAAGFASSIWIGGIVFALAGGAIGLLLLVRLEGHRRVIFLSACLLAAVGALILAAPLIREQIHAVAARGEGFPITVEAYQVLGPIVPETLRRLLDLPAFWLVLLMVEFPAVFLAGAAALFAAVQKREGAGERDAETIALAVLVIVSLLCAWLLVSTAGQNNDLGWRAILPSLLVLTAFAAAGIARWLSRARGAALAALAALALALPDGASLIAGNVTGDVTPAGATFAEDPTMWAAVRRHAPPDARIANNPDYRETLAPWPINISWALLADRRSCWASYGLAVAFVSLPPQRMEDIARLFIRVFDGRGTAEEVTAMARDYGCGVALVTREDGAWTRDPFASHPLYRLAEENPGRWRIYIATVPPPAEPPAAP